MTYKQRSAFERIELTLKGDKQDDEPDKRERTDYLPVQAWLLHM